MFFASRRVKETEVYQAIVKPGQNNFGYEFILSYSGHKKAGMFPCSKTDICCRTKGCCSTCLQVEIQLKLVRMWPEFNGFDLFFPLVLDPDLEKVGGENVAFEQKVVVSFQGV